MGFRSMRTAPSAAGLWALAALSSCKNEPADLPVELQWEKGQRWHLAATYRVGEAHALGEEWSDEIVWTYEVVEDGLVPAAGDELYPYAVTPTGAVQALTVIRATVDPSVNGEDHDLADADPTIYLVFRERRGRLAAVVSFTDAQGRRLEQAWSTRQLERSWSPLSQSMLSAAPTYLAPFGFRVASGSRKVENGATIDAEKVDDATVDVTFEDELGGGFVAARYELGAPWPVWTVGENVEVRLVDAADVSELQRQAPLLPAAPEDYDYRSLLASSVDIDGALDVAAGIEEVGAPEGYQPWNGSWWPQSKGALVFGVGSASTLSDRVQAEAEPVRKEMDALKGQLFTLTSGSSEYTAKLSEVDAKKAELAAILGTFYDGVLADLDGGRLKIEGDRLVHADGWGYDLDALSPMDKAALAFYFDGDTYPSPFEMQEWELLNHWAPGGGSWWGHCNGWSAAAILANEPTSSVTGTIGSASVEFTTADLKGLYTETHYSTYSRFYGARYYKTGDDIADLHPEAFHRLVTFYLRDQRVPLVFDTTANEEVWNFPAYAAVVDVTETTAGGVDLLDVNTATAEELEALPGIGEALAQAILDWRAENGAFQSVDDLLLVDGIGEGTLAEVRPFVTVDPVERTFEVTAVVSFATDGVDEDHVDAGSPARYGFDETYAYTLVTDAHGLVLRGTWKDETKHPDFAWVPYSNPTWPTGSENPHLSMSSLVEAIGTDLTRE